MIPGPNPIFVCLIFLFFCEELYQDLIGDAMELFFTNTYALYVYVLHIMY